MRPYPLDVLGAESEGMIGYLLDQELVNALGGRSVATLLTQVIVDADDPAFADPDEVHRPGLRPRDGASPSPPSGLGGEGGRAALAARRALARAALDRRAADHQAAGRGRRARRLRRRRRHPRGRGPRRPPARRRGGDRQGPRRGAAGARPRRGRAAAADRRRRRRARPRDAAGARRSHEITVDELLALHLPAGSMGPKVEAAAWFAQATGGRAAIGSLARATAVLAGRSGTTVPSRRAASAKRARARGGRRERGASVRSSPGTGGGVGADVRDDLPRDAVLHDASRSHRRLRRRRRRGRARASPLGRPPVRHRAPGPRACPRAPARLGRGPVRARRAAAARSRTSSPGGTT